jgi:hypothetical protein
MQRNYVVRKSRNLPELLSYCNVLTPTNAKKKRHNIKYDWLYRKMKRIIYHSVEIAFINKSCFVKGIITSINLGYVIDY